MTGFEAGFILVGTTIVMCLFMLLLYAVIQTESWANTIKYVFISGMILGIGTLLVSLFMNVIWCSC